MPCCNYTAQEFHSSAQNGLELPKSRLKSILGRPITDNTNVPTTRVVAHGQSFLKTVAGVKYGGMGQLHDLPVNLLSKWPRRAKIPHVGGVGGLKRTCKRLLTEFVNQPPELDPTNPAHAAGLRFRQGIVPRSHD